MTGASPPQDAPAGWSGRRFWTSDAPVRLRRGGELAHVTLAYETWGTLSATGDNVVVICHALTGDSHVAGDDGPDHPTPGWWPGVIGPGLVFDTDRYFIVCANVLGGCRGTTGPASIDPATGEPYGMSFPEICVQDMVAVERLLLDALGVRHVRLVIGGSMGGQQVLAWGAEHPDLVGSLAPIACGAASTPQQIAAGVVGRAAILADPTFVRQGPGPGGARGLAIARMLAHATYRSDESLMERFGRSLVDDDPAEPWKRFQLESYLEHHGDKLVRRFDAWSYLYLTRAMDSFDVADGHADLQAALAKVSGQVLVGGVRTDVLYPVAQQHTLVEAFRAAGVDAYYVEIDSPHGHDGFLLDFDQLAGPVDGLLSAAALHGRG